MWFRLGAEAVVRWRLQEEPCVRWKWGRGVRNKEEPLRTKQQTPPPPSKCLTHPPTAAEMEPTGAVSTRRVWCVCPEESVLWLDMPPQPWTQHWRLCQAHSSVNGMPSLCTVNDTHSFYLQIQLHPFVPTRPMTVFELYFYYCIFCCNKRINASNTLKLEYENI